MPIAGVGGPTIVPSSNSSDWNGRAASPNSSLSGGRIFRPTCGGEHRRTASGGTVGRGPSGFSTGPGDPPRGVAVLGAGPIGLAAVAWARAMGVETVVVSEPSALRRDLAPSWGRRRSSIPARVLSPVRSPGPREADRA